MSRIRQLHSDLSRLDRETEMLDAVISMLPDDQLERAAADGSSRHAVLERLAQHGAALTTEIARALGAPEAGFREEMADVRERLRRVHLDFMAVSARLPELPEDHSFEHRGVTISAGMVVPERIAEVVLAHDDLRSAWTIEEADPDSVLDALEAMLRRLSPDKRLPGLTFRTEEGDHWDLGPGGPTVESDRENLAQWLARGVEGDLRTEISLPKLPRWN